MQLPTLDRSSRDREFKSYSPREISNVILHFLINGYSHRKLDSDVLNLDVSKTKGYQAMGILHYLGFKTPFKGIFKGFKFNEIINVLENQTHDDFNYILELLNSNDEVKIINKELSTTNQVVDTDLVLTEGSLKTIKLTKYERNQKARNLCLKNFGYNCQICDLNFKNLLNEQFKDFIHVHHIIELNSISAEYVVDPIKDLIPVCPNCHAMLHFTKPAMKPDELKKLLSK